jgi:hypothetical protein
LKGNFAHRVIVFAMSNTLICDLKTEGVSRVATKIPADKLTSLIVNQAKMLNVENYKEE